MIKVKYTYWNGSELDTIEFKTNATKSAIKKIMKNYDEELDVGGYDGTLKDFITDQKYRCIIYKNDYDVVYEA